MANLRNLETDVQIKVLELAALWANLPDEQLAKNLEIVDTVVGAMVRTACTER